MKLTWLGTAGFEFKAKDICFLVDPYLTRNPDASPRQPRIPEDITHARQIFLSHGHFDHILDVPRIHAVSGSTIYGSETVAASLIAKDVQKSSIVPVEAPETEYSFDHFTAKAFYSTHIKFDPRLVLSTLRKIKFRFFDYLPLILRYPCGQVLSWRFKLENRIIQFFGTAGSTADELETLSKDGINILLVPVQGHSKICDIAFNYVERLRPEIVIPHHFDHFFPHISQAVDITPLIKKINQQFPDIRVIKPEINRPIDL